MNAFYIQLFLQENGATKKVAGNTCALSALSKLYTMGAIEAYQSKDAKKQALSNDIPDLSIPNNLVMQAESVLARECEMYHRNRNIVDSLN